jgi:hypothetical protein
MTPDELRKHRREICEALIEGKECQIVSNDRTKWYDSSLLTVIEFLFRSSYVEMCNPEPSIRIKPQPRQCWVGWDGKGKGAWCRDTEEETKILNKEYSDIKWQLVVENTGE